MATKVIMPQGGQDIETGKVVRWLKANGSPVKKGEVICEVETEKAVFEVEAPADGYLTQIVVGEGEEAQILSTIGLIGGLDEKIDAAAAPSAGPEKPEVVPVATLKAELEPEGQGEERIKITPRARKLAADLGVPIFLIRGTGPGGRIMEKDVLDAQNRLAAPAVVEMKREEPALVEIQKEEGKPGPRVVQLNKVRKITAQRMQASKQTAPHLYVTVSVDMTDALRFRESYNQGMSNSKEEFLSINDLVVRACVLTLKEFPQLNSSVRDESSLTLWDEVNIGIAVAVEDGLVVPVLENADRLSLREIPRRTRQLASAAKEGRQVSLAPGRFTISNLGMFNVDNFAAIINPPEAAILAVSSVQKRVVPLESALLGIGVRDMMNMTLSLDHRVGDGVMGARFLNKVKVMLENPNNLA